MERSDHSCHLRDRQQTDESRSIGNKTGNKSRDLFFDSFSCGIRGQEGKERKGGGRRSFTTLCASICLIQIFLFMLLLPLLLYLHFFCVLVSFTVLAFSIINYFLSNLCISIVPTSHSASYITVEIVFPSYPSLSYFVSLSLHLSSFPFFHLLISLYFHLSPQ